MTILLHKAYLIDKSDHEGGGVKNIKKNDHMVYGWPPKKLHKTKGISIRKLRYDITIPL